MWTVTKVAIHDQSSLALWCRCNMCGEWTSRFERRGMRCSHSSLEITPSIHLLDPLCHKTQLCWHAWGSAPNPVKCLLCSSFQQSCESHGAERRVRPKDFLFMQRSNNASGAACASGPDATQGRDKVKVQTPATETRAISSTAHFSKAQSVFCLFFHLSQSERDVMALFPSPGGF